MNQDQQGARNSNGRTVSRECVGSSMLFFIEGALLAVYLFQRIESVLISVPQVTILQEKAQNTNTHVHYMN
eukprot:m.9103 g.9103  ORF g.9103 m.9103 type:complete len:71 (-) comp5620_c0_seq1:751-963(-)